MTVLRTRHLTAALTALAALPLAGCSAAVGDTDRPRVVATPYPLQYVVERVAGDRADVVGLASGQEPHDLQLTVAQTAELEDADSVVTVGGLQPAVDEAVRRAEPPHVLDLLDVVAEAEERGEPLTRLVEGDPHAWLDPRAVQWLAAGVRESLSELDPEGADEYRRAHAELDAELTRLHEDTAAALERCERRVVVVAHDAFTYFGNRYDLEFVPIAGLSPEAEPSPAHLAEVQDLARREGITTVFTETLASPELAETLASDLGLRTAVLDPVEGLSDATADEDYLSLMRANVAALVEANDCAGPRSS